MNSRPEPAHGEIDTSSVTVGFGAESDLELSTKCAPSEAFQVAAEARAFLSSQGISLSGEQQTKTRTALEFFSQELVAP